MLPSGSEQTEIGPMQERLILNQNRPEAGEEDEEEPAYMAVGCMPAAPVSVIFTPTTPQFAVDDVIAYMYLVVPSATRSYVFDFDPPT